MKIASVILAPAVLALLVATCGGCGYTTATMFPTDVETVHVPIFQRSAEIYRREIEFSLTEAVQKRIQSDTPYRLSDKSRADTELTGTIERIEQRVTSYDPDTGVPRELLVTMTVSFVWRDLRPNRPNPIRAQAKDLTVTSDYILHEPVNEDFFVGKEDVVNRLAKRIVEHMEADW